MTTRYALALFATAAALTTDAPALARADVINNAYAAVLAVCPQVIGLSIGDWNNKSTWRIDYAPGATCQVAAQAALTSYTVQPTLSVIVFSSFISRWTNAEYAALMQARATAIAGGNVVLVKQWDQAASSGYVDLNTAAAQTFKAAIVSAGILTQARADAIFS